MYGPVCTVVWQGSVGNRRPYAVQRRTRKLRVRCSSRNFQDGRPIHLIAYALRNNITASACLAPNQHSLAMPRVPVVLYLSKGGFIPDG